ASRGTKSPGYSSSEPSSRREGRPSCLQPRLKRIALYNNAATPEPQIKYISKQHLKTITTIYNYYRLTRLNSSIFFARGSRILRFPRTPECVTWRQQAQITVRGGRRPEWHRLSGGRWDRSGRSRRPSPPLYNSGSPVYCTPPASRPATTALVNCAVNPSVRSLTHSFRAGTGQEGQQRVETGISN